MRNTVPAALFLDFDNIHSCLCERGGTAGADFTRYARNWLRWMEEFPLSETSSSRKFISKTCYINPRRNGVFCAPMEKAGFRIVACPPITRRGKTVADMHICVDAMDEIHRGKVKEIAVMSADADFLPLLERAELAGITPIRLAVGRSINGIGLEFPEEIFLREAFIHRKKRGWAESLHPLPAAEAW